MNLTPSVYEIRTTNTTQNIVVGALRAPTNKQKLQKIRLQTSGSAYASFTNVLPDIILPKSV
jgi:hypothetical protein